MMQWIMANWWIMALGAGIFGVGYLDGVRDTNAKWHKKVAESANQGTKLQA